LSTKVEQRLQWRKDKVRELFINGYSQRLIAATLKIGLALVNEDLQYLRARARDNIRHYIDEYLPAEYENCLDGLNNVLTEAWQMSLDGEKRERMQALILVIDSDSRKNSDELDEDKCGLSFPEFVIFDLDPYIYSGNENKGKEHEYSVNGFKSAVEVAFSLKELFDELKIISYHLNQCCLIIFRIAANTNFVTEVIYSISRVSGVSDVL
jgi:hypothetical protein